MTSHAYIFEQFGEPAKVVKWTEVPYPKIELPTQVLVKVKASPLAPADFGYVAGWYEPHTVKFPSRAGYEAVGIVEQVGSAVHDLKVGQRVHFAQLGTFWAEHAIFDTAGSPFYSVVPDYVTDLEASQLTINPLTVATMFTELKVERGNFALQNASASALGRQLILMAKDQGLKTINIVRRKEQVEELKAIGADYVINSETEDIVARVNEITQGQGVKYAFDAVNGTLGSKMVKTLAKEGTLVVYGLLSGQPFQIDSVDIIFKHTTIHGFWLIYYAQKHPEEVKKAYSYIFDLLKQKKLTLPAKAFDGRTEFAQAVAHASQPGKTEKSVLIFN